MTTADQTLISQTLPHVDRPCPAWCPSTAGHPWESRTRDDRMSRFHERPINPDGEFASVLVCTEETAPAAPGGGVSGPSTFTPVCVKAFVDVEDLTSDQASQLAVWLRAAAVAANRYATATFAPVVNR